LKVSEFRKLKTSQRLYDVEREEFTTKKQVLDQIENRAEKIARSGYPLVSEKNYIYGWLIDRLEVANEKRVHKEVRDFMKKTKLDNHLESKS
jgi:hypothetical protein